MASQLSQLSGFLERFEGDGGIWEKKKENEKPRQTRKERREEVEMEGGWCLWGLMLCEGDLGLLWSHSTISSWYLKLIAQRNELSCPHP